MFTSKQIFFSVLLSGICLTAKPQGKPNILLIIADDMSSMSAGVYGEQAIKTPSIDWLAAAGIRFTHAFCTSSSCSPSRASILSGMYPHQLEKGGNLWGTFPSKFPNYVSTLRDKGYVTGLTGKGWGPGQAAPGGYMENPAGKSYKNFNEFIDRLPSGQPFCFWLGTWDPHRPYDSVVTKETEIDRTKIKVPAWLPDHQIVRNDLMDYLAEVKRFDSVVGAAIRVLSAKNMLENTLIIVTSDNGMPFPRAKATVYDGGTLVPLVMTWGNRFRKGAVYNDLVSLVNLAPTILEATGITPDKRMEGRSLLPLLTKNARDKYFDTVYLERERHAFVREHNLGYPVRAIRTKDFLYIENLRPDRWPAGDPAINNRRFGDIDNGPSKDYLISHRQDSAFAKWVNATIEKKPATELYDLRNDKSQFQNKAYSMEYQSVLRKLKKALDNWRTHTDDPLLHATEDIFDSYEYYGIAPRTIEHLNIVSN